MSEQWKSSRRLETVLHSTYLQREEEQKWLLRYREISSLSISTKLYGWIVIDKVLIYSEGELGEEQQYDFRKLRGDRDETVEKEKKSVRLGREDS